MILAHLILLAMLLSAKLSGEMIWMTLIVGLGLGETPILTWASHHAARAAYFQLCYGLDLINVALYVACAWQLGRTLLDMISFTIWIYLGIKTAMWLAILLHWDHARFAIDSILRALNLLSLLFWAWLIFRYDQAERRLNHG